MASEKKTSKRRKKAVALRYAAEDAVPRVVASGVGVIAERILDLAQENKIPIRRDDSLVEILGNLDLGVEIPAETYKAVAEILAFLFRTDLAWRKKKEKELGGVIGRVKK